MLTPLWLRVKELVFRERLDREAQEELAQHLELLAAEKARGGLDPAEARRQARLELGNPQEARERLRDGRGGSGLDAAAKDLGYALRQLRQRPGFTVACLLTVALGVGASTALFARGARRRAEAAAAAGPRLARQDLRLEPRQGNVARRDHQRQPGRLAPPRAQLPRARRNLHDGPHAHARQRFRGGALGAGDGGLLRRAGRALGPRPLLHAPRRRGSRSSTTRPRPSRRTPWSCCPTRSGSGASAGDPGVIGRSVTVERRPMRVVGVTAKDFAMPAPDVDLFLPWGLPETPPRDQHYVTGLARLGPGTSLEQAEAELRGVAGALAVEHPRTNEGWSVELVPLHEDTVGDVRLALLVLLLAVALVLVVSSANVALLSLARSLERLPEASLRQALGASRGRLIRQFLMEPLVVSLGGGALGRAAGGARAGAVEAQRPRRSPAARGGARPDGARLRVRRDASGRARVGPARRAAAGAHRACPRPGRGAGPPRRSRQPPRAARRASGRGGRDRGGAAGRRDAAAAQLPALAGGRSRLPGQRRAGRSGLPGHGAVRRGREEPRLLRHAARAAALAAGCRRRGCRDRAAGEPARARTSSGRYGRKPAPATSARGAPPGCAW